MSAKLSRIQLSLGALAASLVFAPPAQAQSAQGWERIHHATAIGGGQTSECGTPILRASDNQPLIVTAGASFSIQILGHGIDLRQEAPTISGLPGVEIGSRVERRNGLENARRRGCGAIGSATVSLRFPEELADERTVTLRIGNGVTVPIRVLVRNRLTVAEWAQSNFLKPAASAPPPPAPPAPTPPPTPPQPCIPTSPAGTGCNGVVVFPITPSTLGSGSTQPGSLYSCIANIPGALVTGGGANLRVILPDDRRAVADRGCFGRPFVIRTVSDFPAGAPRSHFGADQFRMELPLTVSSPSANRASVLRSNSFVLYYMAREVLEDLRGQITVPITITNPAGDRHVVRLTVSSATGFAIDRVELNPSAAKPAAILRQLPTNNVTARFHLQPTEVVGDYHWALEPLGQGSPARCFAQTSGRFSPSSASQRSVDVTLTPTRAAGCAGTSVNLVAWSGPDSNRNHPLYRRTVTVPST
jgi:hypothetical protein